MTATETPTLTSLERCVQWERAWASYVKALGRFENLRDQWNAQPYNWELRGPFKSAKMHLSKTEQQLARLNDDRGFLRRIGVFPL